MSYLLTFLMVALCGNPIFRIYNIELVYIAFSCVLFFMALNKGMLSIYSAPAFKITVAFVALLCTVQYIDQQYLQINAYIGFTLKLFIIYSLLRLVGGFEYILVRVMYFVALMGIIGYAVYLLYPQVMDYGVTIMGENESYFYHKSLYIYTLLIDGLSMRNAGMFSEPGLFAGILNIALIQLLALKESMSEKTYKRIFSVFFIAILTTYSTQGYLILALLLLYIFYKKLSNTFAVTQGRRVFVVIGLGVVLLSLNYAFQEIPFLSQKIKDQSALVSNEEHNFEITRWGGFLTSLQYIFEKPVWGWGIDVISAINLKRTQKVISSGTGMTDIILKLGIPFFVFMVSKVYKCFDLIFGGKAAAFFYLIVFLLLIQGEPFFNFPLIYMFYFIGFKHKPKLKPALNYA
jgi:hypothetical protein